MFDSRIVDSAASPQAAEAAAGQALAARCLALTLDEIDYGVLLLADDGQVLHANHMARSELDAGHPLQLLGRELRARHAQDVVRLHEALAGAQRGLRKLLTLGEAAHSVSVSVAVIPLPRAPQDATHPTLVVLGKRQVCGRLAVHWFARDHALTPAESRVLEALCDGLEPREIADSFKVGLATVRTQIGHIRGKTGANSIRELVRQVSVLPPMVSTLRMAA